jgi:hypothetical protein
MNLHFGRKVFAQISIREFWRNLHPKMHPIIVVKFVKLICSSKKPLKVRF